VHQRCLHICHGLCALKLFLQEHFVETLALVALLPHGISHLLAQQALQGQPLCFLLFQRSLQLLLHH